MAAPSWPGTVSRPIPCRYREMRQEHCDLGRAHIARAAIGIEQDKPPHTINAGVIGVL